MEERENDSSILASTVSVFFCCLFVFNFYLGFFSQTLMNHRTAGEGGGQFFNSSLPLAPASQTLRY